MTKFLGNYNVIPSLPENLELLRKLAFNLHWSWNQDTLELFRRLDRDLWEETHHNPVMMLGKISQERLEEVTHDDGFLAHKNRAFYNLEVYLSEKTWYQKNFGHLEDFNIVYFSAEFGLTECLQTYSGGLGILAGDHLKAASDLGIPLTGLGLLYKEGYFQQYLTSDGWQHERYEINDFQNQPMTLELNENKEPLMLSVRFPERDVFFQIWKIQIGRIPLYLLDTNVSKNSESDRKITETLYGGNAETRIQQEIILGIGGIRALQALGIKPTVCHMNEGHSAFLSLERIKVLMQKYELSYREAKEIGYYSNIFTTHTPVPAGIDVFANDLVEKYFGHYYREELKISDKDFYSLGNINKDKDSSVFNMAHLAMNTAGFINGVSRLHSIVSKKMWSFGYKDVPFNEIPIGYVTNGVHTRSHISREMEELFVRYLGENWIHNPAAPTLWERIDKIPDEELWRIHERRREKLVTFVRRRLIDQIKSRGGSQSELNSAAEVLNPRALTIGFARRFATYKRATLIFRDFERLVDILSNKNKPVQFIIAGKAHPKDDEGKRLIQEIYQLTKEEQFKKKIVFIENYDMNVARYMVEGCDVWLNNPRRPLEASGTSGMKVIANGGLNFSVLDGWWDEGFDPELGWKIGNGEEYSDPDYQDEVESRQLYNTLETDIIPLFYERGEDRLPRGWMKKIKVSMNKLGQFFNTHRMVIEYFNKYYYPSLQKRLLISDKKWEKAKKLTSWKSMVKENWRHVSIKHIETENFKKELKVNEDLIIKAEIDLGSLTPQDVMVQIYYGIIDKQDDPKNNMTVNMAPEIKKTKDGYYRFVGSIKCKHTGQHGFTVRILPSHELMIHPFELGLIYWAV
jgi:starch phosphorylase